MPRIRILFKSVVVLSFFISVCASASGQQPTTEGEFWPAVDAHVQLPDNYRLLGFVGLKKGDGFPYQQLNTGLGLGYQWKEILKPHQENIDPDK